MSKTKQRKPGTSKAAQLRTSMELRKAGPAPANLGIPPATPLDGMLMQMSQHRQWYKHQMENNKENLQAQTTQNVPPKPLSALVGWAVRSKARGTIK